ncbi:MAG: hypothetical protein IKW83_00960 [Muribaculaceae bacterium]|nr:hypothetical protein [Muribaculaceae bacterium]
MGCLKGHRVGWWFTIPVAFSILMFIIVVWDVVRRLCKLREARIAAKRQGQNMRGTQVASGLVGHQLNLKLLAKVVLLVWGLGWTLYFIPVNAVHGSHVGAEALFHPAFCALQMFAFHMDSFVIDAHIFNNYDVVKGLISIVCFAAAICTMIAVLGLVMSRLMAYFHVKNFMVDKDFNHLYIFFGINDSSLLLANSILDEETGDSKAKVVFVETNLAGEKDSKSETDGWKGILSMFIHRRKTFALAQENKRRALAISSANIASLDITNKYIDVWGSLGLNSVKNLLDDKNGLGGLCETTKEKGKLFLFFLSEDRQENVLGATNITHDILLKEAIKDNNHKFSIDIYCHVADYATGRMLKDAVVNKKMSMHILNYSLLAVEGLKRDVKNQPVNFVDVEPLESANPGSVSSPFVSLVIGFGETGQQALNFLYEYGAFPSAQSSATNSFRSEFVCHVVDKEMNSKVGAFHANRPAVPCIYVDAESISKEPAVSHLDSKPEGKNAMPLPKIKFFNCDYKSVGFYEKVLLPIADRLNYVVVALGDPRLNIRVAIDVLRYVRRHRPNLDNFRIFVRGYDKDSYDFIDAIGERYNKLLHYDNFVGLDKEKVPEYDRDVDQRIVIFGTNEKICTYDLFVQDKYQRDAKKYQDAYNRLHGYDNPEVDAWQARRMEKLGTDDRYAWSRLSELRRKEGQDRSNAVHSMTKMALLCKALDDDEKNTKRMELVNRMFMRRIDGKIESTLSKDAANFCYPDLSEQENKLLLNVTITEHMRWLASHEMMGYIVDESQNGCNEVSKQHSALRPWHELSAEYKKNNFGVTETTLNLELFEPESVIRRR